MTIGRFEANGPAGGLVGRERRPGGAGTALPAVLVHGINMSSDVWREVVERVGVVRRVVALDLRGHGESGRYGPFTPEDYADDVLAAMDHLGIPKAHVAGVSFGGSVACVLASRVPERIASIAAIGSALAVEGLDVDGAVAAIRASGVRAFFAGFLPQASFAPGVDPALIERALEAASRNREIETVVEVSTIALRSDVSAAASRARVPALVVTGELDRTCPPLAGEAMARSLRTELRVVPKRGHVLPMEDPDAVARLLTGHWSSVEAAR